MGRWRACTFSEANARFGTELPIRDVSVSVSYLGQTGL
jgi:hypothetical protein